MYKTELHSHSGPASLCAKTSPEALVETYIKNGYSTLVLTNHMSYSMMSSKLYRNKPYNLIASMYINDYYRAKKYARGRVNILLGMEYNNIEGPNEYLFYGIDEQFIYSSKDIVYMPLDDVFKLVHQKGALIFQAHPFRDNMTRVDKNLIDGIEAGNYSIHHNSRNELAKKWANENDIKRIYGSDYHSPSFMCGAGILTEHEITSNELLVDVLKKQNFQATDGKKIFMP